MTIRPFLSAIAALGVLLAGPVAAQAQAQAQDAPSGRDDEQDQPRGSGVEITPYIEAAQVLTAEITPGSDVVTYTRLAVGVDAVVAGRNNSAAVSLRYERVIGWDDKAPDGDVVSGLVRASAGLIPQTLTLEAGAMATQSRVTGSGASITGPYALGDQSSQVYSAYAGPALTTHAGDVAINASYWIGYTKVDSDYDYGSGSTALPQADLFDESLSQVAQASAGIRAGEVLPVGITASAGLTQEDMSVLDQRVRDFHARVDVTVPVSHDLALVGGMGYENVEVSLRDAVYDTNGDPVIDADGQYVTDPNAPRLISYEAEGLIWDVGVIWRPSRRTQLEAHVGWRYDSWTAYGNFGWQPTSRSSLNISVYDGIMGLGGSLNSQLYGLSTDFVAVRNPVTGDLSNCVQTLSGNNCLDGSITSLRGAAYRSRGIAGSYAVDAGAVQTGVAMGYDRRQYLAPAGSVIAALGGQVDEVFWTSAYLNYRLDQRSGINGNVYGSYFDSGFNPAGDSFSYGASTSYYRDLIDHLTASVAVSLDGISTNQFDDFLSASALVALRYSF